jgi:hypothetical protein
MPASCCRPDYDALFDDRAARRELAAYRRKGPTGTSKRLIDSISDAGIEGATILDVGGGVGVVGVELLDAGALALTDVDASGPYLAAARSEAQRRGFGSRATFLHGDFVELASSVKPADVVTLDRVVCCYDDWRALIDAAVSRSRRLIALAYPADRWWLRIGVGAIRSAGRLFGRALPFHVHPERSIDERIREAGFAVVHRRRGLTWQTAVYERIP